MPDSVQSNPELILEALEASGSPTNQDDADGRRAHDFEKQLELDRIRANHSQLFRLREIFATWSLYVTGAWLIFVSLTILLHGFKLWFHLSDTVLIALLGTTTANVLGLVLVVLKSLFPNDKPTS